MAGTYTVSATKNGCVSAPISINVTIKQSPASPIASSNSPLCSGNILNLTSSTILPETITYSWTGPNGFVSNLQNPSISNSNPVNSGTYNVISFSKQTNCSSQIASTSVVINALPIIFSSSYADPVNCISTSGIITLNGLLPITIYVAQYIKNGNTPGSVTTATNRDGNLIITGLTRGSYTNVRVFLNGCSSNEVGPFTLVESFHLPAKPTASGNLPLCVGNTLKLAASSITPGVNYAWKGPNGFASNEQNPKIINVTSKATGQYFVTAIADNCISDTTILNIIVNDNPIVNLGPDLILAEGSQHTMTSEIENGPISTYLWTPSTNLSCSNCAAPVANIKKDISYILTATNINGCTASGKINIKVICENTQVFIPDAFTPDGDGINDIMMVRASGSITVKSFRIFNKWGQLIFEKLNFPPNNPSYGWDGKIKGIIGPPDVFIYTAEVVCDNGSTFIYKGNISLLK